MKKDLYSFSMNESSEELLQVIKDHFYGKHTIDAFDEIAIHKNISFNVFKHIIQNVKDDKLNWYTIKYLLEFPIKNFNVNTLKSKTFISITITELLKKNK